LIEDPQEMQEEIQFFPCLSFLSDRSLE
jgi:hypothetical protein